MSITAILVTHNSENIIRHALQPIYTHKNISEFIVVDNASQDSTIKLVSSLFPAVKIIRNESNLGFATACNLALENIATDFALIINPDAVIDNEAIDRLVETSLQYPNAAIIAPYLGEDNFDPNTISIGLPSIYKKGNKAKLIRENIYSVPFISGAVTIWKMKHMRKIGFYDSNFFLFYEDDDISIRASKAGHELLLVTGLQVKHVSGTSCSLSDELQRVKLLSSIWSYFYIHRKYKGLIRARLMALLTILKTNNKLSAINRTKKKAGKEWLQLSDITEMLDKRQDFWNKICSEENRIWKNIYELENNIWNDFHDRKSQLWQETQQQEDRLWKSCNNIKSRILQEIQNGEAELWSYYNDMKARLWQETQSQEDELWLISNKIKTKLWDETQKKEQELWAEINRQKEIFWNILHEHEAIHEKMEESKKLEIWNATQQTLENLWQDAQLKKAELWQSAYQTLENLWQETQARKDMLWAKTQQALKDLWIETQTKREALWNSIPISIDQLNIKAKDEKDRSWKSTHHFIEDLWSETQNQKLSLWSEAQNKKAGLWLNIAQGEDGLIANENNEKEEIWAVLQAEKEAKNIIYAAKLFLKNSKNFKPD